MDTTPDAPWIRDAEMNGVETGPEIECPICGKVCDTVYEDAYGEVCGCENCMVPRESWDWWNEKKEADRPDWADE